MNFKIAKKEFLDVLSLCSRAISTTTPLPSLLGVKITATPNSLTLISSDSNISIKTSINNNDTSTLIISEPGEIVLDARYLLEMVRKIDSEFINVEIIDGTFVRIYSGKSEYKINGMEASDYPQISFDTSRTTPFKLQTTLFNQIIDETAFACSEKETRPVLTGVNLKARDNKIFANATDSYRLASKTIAIDKDLSFDITIPKKYLTEIYHAIADKEEVTIAIDNQKISFLFDNTIIETRLLDDEFPNTERLIPTSISQKLVVSSKKMIDAIDSTLFIKADGKNTVRLDVNEERVELTSSNQTGISYNNEIPVIRYEGEPLEISCSGKYLQEAIKAIGSDEIMIDFARDMKRIVIKKEGDDSLIQLVSLTRTYH